MLIFFLFPPDAVARFDLPQGVNSMIPSGLRITVVLSLGALACHGRLLPHTAQPGPGDLAGLSKAPCPTGKPDAVEALGNRARQLWQARRDQDWAQVYLFEKPKVRKQTSVDDYVARSEASHHLRVESFELIRAQAEPDRGWVLIRYRSNLPRFPDVPSRQVELWQKWHRIDGNWHPVPPGQLSDYPEAPALRNVARERRLRLRFQESWRWRQAKNWSQLYQLCDPGDREAIPEDEFIRAQSSIEYLSHELDWVEVIGQRGRIRVGYHHKLTDPSLTKLQPTTMFVIEHWVIHGNNWYRDLKRP